MNDTDARTGEGEERTDPDRPVHLSNGAELEAFLAGPGTALVEFYTDGCGI